MDTAKIIALVSVVLVIIFIIWIRKHSRSEGENVQENQKDDGKSE